ncbi:MAG: low molecular weight phosphatase family protein [Pseudomonadota bacterium]
MRVRRPGSILFCCNFNTIRSPLAEALLKRSHGREIFVQSAGVRHETEMDPFMVAAAAEIGVDLGNHRPKSFDEMEEWGDDIGGYDEIIALSPAAQRKALEYTRHFAVEVIYWPTLDPSALGESRAQKLDAYRQTRDQILAHMASRFA